MYVTAFPIQALKLPVLDTILVGVGGVYENVMVRAIPNTAQGDTVRADSEPPLKPVRNRREIDELSVLAETMAVLAGIVQRYRCMGA